MGNVARCMRDRRCWGEAAHSAFSSSRTMRAFGVVRDSGDIRASQHELRAAGRVAAIDERGEASHHAPVVLQRVPARNLQDDRVVPLRSRALAQHDRFPLDRPRCPVLAREAPRPASGRPGDEACLRQDGSCHRLVLLLVLRRERIDRGLHDHAATIVKGRGDVRLPREDAQRRLAHVRREERPAALRLRCDVLGPDMATPDDGGAVRHQRRRHARRLRVVQEDGVAGTNLAQEGRDVGSEHLAVDPRRLRAQR